MSQEAPEVVSMDKAPQVSPELRARILKDPNVAKMAEALNKPLEEFVNTIGYYMQNPGVEPVLIGATDEALKKQGITVPTADQIAANVRQTVAAIDARAPKSGFADAKAAPVTLAPKVESPAPEPNAELEAAIKKARGHGKL
jgi:hypothetical protein